MKRSEFSNNQMWSFLECLRASVTLVMNTKASQAFGVIQPHIAAVSTALAQAAYRREIVRRYNGNTEMSFQGGTFVISPTGTDPTRLPYPNQVLGTAVAYNGFNTVPFTAADFGP